MADAQTTIRVPGIESLRAIAAFAVLVCHALPYWKMEQEFPRVVQHLASTGAHGVDLFVVISGLCLALPSLRGADQLDVGRFWKRRAMRLLPPYYVALGLAFVAAVIPSLWPRMVARQANAGDIAAHLTLTQTFFPDRIGAINGSFWSIALEAQLYALFPLTLLAWRRLGPRAVIAGTSVLSVVWLALEGTGPGWLGSTHLVPARLVQFVAGMACASMLASGRQVPSRVAGSATVIGFLGAVAVSTVELTVVGPLAWTVPSVAGVLWVCGSASASRALQPLERLGVVSYSFYLLHQPALLLTADVGAWVSSDPWVRLLLACVVVGGVVFMLATVLYRLVERPSQERGRKVGPTRVVLAVTRRSREIAAVRPTL